MHLLRLRTHHTARRHHLRRRRCRASPGRKFLTHVLTDAADADGAKRRDVLGLILFDHYDLLALGVGDHLYGYCAGRWQHRRRRWVTRCRAPHRRARRSLVIGRRRAFLGYLVDFLGRRLQNTAYL